LDATVWQAISIVGYSLSVVFFVAAIILFFKMNIRGIIGDLSGKTAERKIKEIRERNLMTGSKRYKPAAFHLERGTSGTLGNRKERNVGKTAQAIAHASKRLDLKAKTDETFKPMKEGTEHVTLSEPTTVLFSEEPLQSSITEVLQESTELLDQRTEVFFMGPKGEGEENATEVLVTDDRTEVLDDTTVLYPTEELEEHEKGIPAVDFKIVKDIKIVHTNETI
jgi:molybdopterin-guanine dinucleotide biosynthesis protein